MLSNWTGDFKSCVLARTEIMLDQKHHERLLKLYGAVFTEARLPSYAFAVLDLMIEAMSRRTLQQWS